MHIHDLKAEGELVKLHAVGGTMLLIKADIHRDGLIFPPFLYGKPSPLICSSNGFVKKWQVFRKFFLEILRGTFGAQEFTNESVGEIDTEGLGILPTESSKQAWISSGAPEERICLCPLRINPEHFTPGVEPMPLTGQHGKPLNAYRVKILNISDVMPRKNLLSLLRVWNQATRPTDDAVLILKISCGSEKWLKIFFQRVDEMEVELHKSCQEAAPIVWSVIYSAYPFSSVPNECSC